MQGFHDHWAPDWVRWGDSASLRYEQSDGSQTQTTPQLVDVRFDRPETWTFLTTVDFNLPEGSPDRAGTVTVRKTIGVGSAKTIVKTVIPFASMLPQIVDRDELPAQTIQVEVVVMLDSVPTDGVQVDARAFVAPRYHEARVGRVMPDGRR